MLVFLTRRLAHALAALVAMSLLVFAAVYAIGNPIDILVSPQADQADIARAAAALGLDRSLPEQYLIFLRHALHGDLGNSFVFGTPAAALVLQRLPATLELAVVAMLIALALGIPLGLHAGWRPRSIGARLIAAGSVLGFSLPTFWLGLLLILVFAVWLGWLPASGRGDTRELFGVPVSFLSLDGWRHLILPAANLALFRLALVIRLARAGARSAQRLDYVRLARAAGLSERRILRAHVLKNTLIPIVTVSGVEFGSLIAFAVVTETIFAWPGMGKLLMDSIRLLDRPVLLACLCVAVLVFVVVNFAVDVLYAWLDPRARVGDARR